jgi:hypothetical protein
VQTLGTAFASDLIPHSQIFFILYTFCEFLTFHIIPLNIRYFMLGDCQKKQQYTLQGAALYSKIFMQAK